MKAIFEAKTSETKAVCIMFVYQFEADLASIEVLTIAYYGLIIKSIGHNIESKASKVAKESEVKSF